MRRTFGLLLASAGLAFFIAGCASQNGGAAAPSGGGSQAAGGATTASAGGGGDSMRDFNLRVKCPGIHELKVHGWSDQQIIQQLSVSQEDIPACEAWVQNQPKGYVPPPPGGAGAAPAAAPSPASK